jgi:hypothetical protein
LLTKNRFFSTPPPSTEGINIINFFFIFIY